MPIASPTAVATTNELNRATSAAATAGTISRLVPAGSRRTTGAARMIARAASIEASAQFATPYASGDSPIWMAPSSCSAVARVASPKRVYRYASHSTPVSTSATASSRNRSRGTDAPAKSTTVASSTLRITSAVAPRAPNRRSISAMK